MARKSLLSYEIAQTRAELQLLKVELERSREIVDRCAVQICVLDQRLARLEPPPSIVSSTQVQLPE